LLHSCFKQKSKSWPVQQKRIYDACQSKDNFNKLEKKKLHNASLVHMVFKTKMAG